jgi:hypothetical protein
MSAIGISIFQGDLNKLSIIAWIQQRVFEAVLRLVKRELRL